jgi:anti-sigma-K factor RskA
MADERNSAGSGSYVLDAMERFEREDFELQLAGSEELRNEVTELTDTAVLLGMAVNPATPSPALKRSIMARLSQIPQLPREDAPVRTLRAVPPLAADPIVESRPEVRAHATARERWYTRPAVAITASAAAVLLVAGGILGANVAVEGAKSSQQADALAAITTASDVRRAHAIVSSGGTATLVWSLHLGKSALVGTSMKVLPSDKTYELWYIGPAGPPIPAGLFESNGKSTLQVLSGHLARGATIAVTVEPSGGSKAPTTKPIVAIVSD